jgi:uncharacterized protein with FMN-binding domain
MFLKKFLKWAGIGLLGLIAIMMGYAILGLDDVLKVKIDDVDMTKISDGTYIGSYDNYRWTNSVEVTVTAHRITGIESVTNQSGRDDLVLSLTDRIIEQQTPNVDAVSGATASSNGFLKAVEIALKSSVE